MKEVFLKEILALFKLIDSLSPQEKANIDLLVICINSVLIWYTGCFLENS